MVQLSCQSYLRIQKISYQAVHHMLQEDEDLHHQVCDQHQDCQQHVVELPVPTAGLFKLVNFLGLPSMAPMKVREVCLVIL